MEKKDIYYLAGLIVLNTGFLLFFAKHPVIGLFTIAAACFLLLKGSYEDMDNIEY